MDAGWRFVGHWIAEGGPGAESDLGPETLGQLVTADKCLANSQLHNVSSDSLIFCPFYLSPEREHLPMRKRGMLRKNPPMAQVLVSDAFFRYFVVLGEDEDVTSLLGVEMDCTCRVGRVKNVRRSSWIFTSGGKVVKGPHHPFEKPRFLSDTLGLILECRQSALYRLDGWKVGGWCRAGQADTCLGTLPRIKWKAARLRLCACADLVQGLTTDPTVKNLAISVEHTARKYAHIFPR